MRKMTVTCDACKADVKDFNGGVTVALGEFNGGIVRADACSTKCVVELLKALAKEIALKLDNAAFLKEHPNATLIPGAPGTTPAVPAWDTEKWGTMGPPPATNAPVSKGTPPAVTPPVVAPPAPPPPAATAPPPVAPPAAPSEPGPVVAGCAACSKGVAVNVDTAYMHTGEGPLCKTPTPPSRMVDGPCTCPTTNWTIEPKDNNPGLHVVTCSQCHASWSVTIPGSTEGETERKGKGRPRGSKNRKTLEAEAAAAAAANGAANGTVAETPENKSQRDAALGRTPDVSTDEMARLKASREGSSIPVVVNGTATTPGENLSQLVTDVAKLGLTLNLIDVAQWTSMQRDLVRSWVAHPEFDPPEFLETFAKARAGAAPPPSLPPLPSSPPAPEPAKSRFSF
jgi:hypothetical protein